MLSNEKERGECRSVPLQMGRRGGGCVRATDTTKGCKIHFPFLSLSNRRAEVAEGAFCVVPLSISRGRENGAIKFISTLKLFFRIFLRKRGLSGGVCRGRGTAVRMEKPEARSGAVKVFLPEGWGRMSLFEWRVE